MSMDNILKSTEEEEEEEEEGLNIVMAKEMQQ